jgi:hypothetical protein
MLVTLFPLRRRAAGAKLLASNVGEAVMAAAVKIKSINLASSSE